MNTTKNIGIVGTIISGLLLCFSIYKYNQSVEFYKASGYLNTIWGERTNNYKLMIIICAIILLISVILLISSLLKSKDNIQTSNTTQSKLKELEQIYNDNLITKEEYENKRKELLSKL